MKNLISELYAADRHTQSGPEAERDRLFYRAAKEIERLVAENERLQGRYLAVSQRLAGTAALNVSS